MHKSLDMEAEINVQVGKLILHPPISKTVILRHLYTERTNLYMYGYFKREMLQWVYRISSEWKDPDTGKITSQRGSGFIVNSNNNPFLVTNRHVVDPNFEKRRNTKLTEVKIVGFSRKWLPLTVTIIGNPVKPWFASNIEEDVAVISLASHIVRSDPFLALNWIQRKYFLDDLEFDGMVELCDLLVIPGYPDYYDRSNNKAIARMGNIASDPSDDYQGPHQQPARRIAFEALSTGGNSGSPVFAVARGNINEIDLNPSAPPSRGAKLLGINAGHFKNPLNGSHEGVSYFFRSQVILDIFEEMKIEIE